LLNPPDRVKGGGVKWALVVHTVTMFLLTTISTAMGMALQSTSDVDNREFPGDDESPPGPFGYNLFLFSKAIIIVPNVLFLLSNWLADGLLLYRCWVLYGMNYWVIAFPCLLYLACVGTGILSVYSSSLPDSNTMSAADIIKFSAPYFSIAVALNVLLTLMIALRLILHSRNIRNAMGPLPQSDLLYKTIATILIESSALYAANFLIYIGLWAAKSPFLNIFIQSLTETQVIAPFLITLRIANRTALTSDTVVSRNIESIRFRSAGEGTEGDESLPTGDPMGSVDANAPNDQ